MITGQVGAIVWAQWRSLVNYSVRKQRGGSIIALVFGGLWYGLWTFAAFGIAVVAADPDRADLVRSLLPSGLLFVFLYWQIAPIMMATSGLSLDFTRLLMYPIPHRQLFGIEVVLRVTTALEMVLLCVGLSIGLALNPDVPWWAVSGIAGFMAMNLFLSAGLRDLFTRLMGRKGVREIAVFFVVLLAAAPQLLVGRKPDRNLAEILESGFGDFWPWSAAAQIAAGNAGPIHYGILAGFIALSYWFSRRQFERNLVTDAAEARATRAGARTNSRFGEGLFALTRKLFPDPTAALVEKELRTLSRSPRFRLLFFMGFSFGLLIWLPMTLRSDADSLLRGNFLTVVSVYALMLLGEVCFWNIFGMDRTAALAYLVMPVKFTTVLVAKNIAAILFVALEIGTVTLFCYLLRMPVTGPQIGEAFAVTAVLAVYLLAIGNLLSTAYPRAVNPAQSWRTGSVGRIQAMLLLVYPLVSIPVVLAYGAQYAFDSDAIFYFVLAIGFALGLVVYWIALDSAASNIRRNHDRFIQALSSAEGPVNS